MLLVQMDIKLTADTDVETVANGDGSGIRTCVFNFK